MPRVLATGSNIVREVTLIVDVRSTVCAVRLKYHHEA